MPWQMSRHDTTSLYPLQISRQMSRHVEDMTRPEIAANVEKNVATSTDRARGSPTPSVLSCVHSRPLEESGFGCTARCTGKAASKAAQTVAVQLQSLARWFEVQCIFLPVIPDDTGSTPPESRATKPGLRGGFVRGWTLVEAWPASKTSDSGQM
jgi:hypothetical protein